ncbi:glycoside hydrolase superfamily [Microdochium trichocladiopsis]|uniref:Glycoside hydrolase superfamily n=1 Tax=Microdochium trichocladiopsis TaxID=1682393 RepID=A0A9P8Y456_9PEZI|nr:glycoside hydrolase superfamily [Microdochium trichocladiopsis]KAH7029326.1 glycoside hydrolase superfamily [Microdochium trichocladiopsis]
MKLLTAIIALLPLFGLAAGQPSRYNHQGGSPKRHDSLFGSKRRHMPSQERAVVYVNQDGVEIPPPVGQQPPASSGGQAPPAAAPPPNAAVDAATAASPANVQAAAPATSQIQGASGGGWPQPGTGGNGITYSPYTSSGGCKTQDQVSDDIGDFAASYGTIRLYGVDCDQVEFVSKALGKNYNNKLLLGIFNLKDIAGQVQTMAQGLKGNWSRVDTVSVGNELVNNGGASVGQVVAALKEAKEALKSAGYTGNVVIVDTFNAVIANPQICDVSSYCAVNMHPFFDPNTSADQAGAFMTTQLARIKSVLKDKSQRIVVTETGWPWKGSSNGRAVPGVSQQEAALTAIKGAFASSPTNVFLFTAFNDLWKKSEKSTFYAEQFWGMGQRNSRAG